MDASFDLLPGERIVWSGKPNRDKLLMRSDYWFMPVGLLFGLLAIASFIAAIVALFADGGAGAFVGLLASIVLGFISFQLVIGRVVRRRRAFGSLKYAITDRRVLALTGDALRAHSLGEMQPTLVNQYERRGDIRTGNLTMQNLDDAAVVFEILSGQIAAARQG